MAGIIHPVEASPPRVAPAKGQLGTPKNDTITGTDRGEVVSARGGDLVVGRDCNDEVDGVRGDCGRVTGR